MAEKRIFSETDAAEIVKRAVQIQEQQQRDQPAYVPGITEDELGRVAAEVGLSPAALEQAISEYKNKNRPPEKGFSLKSEEERVVEGELSPDDFDLLTDVIKTSANQPPPTQVGRTIRAKTMVGGSVADVAVTSRNGRTRIQVSSIPLLGIIFGAQMAFMSTIFGSVMIGENGWVGAGAALITAGFVGGASLLTGIHRAGKRKTRELADKLEERIKEELETSSRKAEKNPRENLQRAQERKIQDEEAQLLTRNSDDDDD